VKDINVIENVQTFTREVSILRNLSVVSYDERLLKFNWDSLDVGLN
jgi:hypothetical protein